MILNGVSMLLETKSLCFMMREHKFTKDHNKASITNSKEKTMLNVTEVHNEIYFFYWSFMLAPLHHCLHFDWSSYNGDTLTMLMILIVVMAAQTSNCLPLTFVSPKLCQAFPTCLYGYARQVAWLMIPVDQHKQQP